MAHGFNEKGTSVWNRSFSPISCKLRTEIVTRVKKEFIIRCSSFHRTGVNFVEEDSRPASP